MRHLATIQKINKIIPIPDADAIELALINGWQCVVKKNEFQEDGVGVYFEIDSFLPASDCRYGFLEKNFTTFEGNRGARIRTMKLRGTLSQGLLLPLYMFPELFNTIYSIGQDVTDLLNIKKWEPTIPLSLAGEVEGAFPSFIPKTDEERIQNLGDILASEIIGHTFIPTVKMDGSSCTIFYKDGHFGVCSRNWELKYTEGNAFWKVVKKYKLDEVLPKLGFNIAIQGELMGPNIQGNHEKLEDVDLFVFNAYDIDTNQYIPFRKDNGCGIHEMLLQLANDYGCYLKTVPVQDSMSFGPETTIQSILDMADGPSYKASTREGLVFKRSDSRLSFKAISNAYLLKHQDR